MLDEEGATCQHLAKKPSNSLLVKNDADIGNAAESVSQFLAVGEKFQND
jgi:hypothetical protein